MDTQQNKELVRQGYQMFQEGKIDELLQLFSDDVEWVGNPIEYVPFSRAYHGRQEVAQFFSELGQDQDVEMFEPQEMIAEGDKVAVIGREKWNVRTTGKSYESPWVHVFTIRDGKIMRFKQYYDTAATQAAFMPAQAAQGASAGTEAGAIH